MPKMQRFKRAVAVTGTYTNKDGEEKKSYVTVGTLFKYEDGGFSLKLDAMPLGGEGWISFYDFDDSKSGQQQQSKGGGNYGSRSRADSFDGDDIPFASCDSVI